MVAGLGLDGFAMITVRRQHTNILPHRSATCFVRTCLFSVSRNPIYVGNTVMLLGAATAFSNAWFLVVVPFAVIAFSRLAISWEEIHMDASFGAAWRD